MTQPHYYEVNVKWKEGRKGELSSPILNETIECATPPEFSGGIPNVWSPEHLYAASINSCYMATFLAIAENYKLAFNSFYCSTKIKLELNEGKYLITEAELTPEVILTHPETDTEKTNKILEKSKAHCLVTNSMKTAVTVIPKIS
ncbi:MAG: OsmC family protein [Ferruginibacter sp.]|nr:OsmC family protein [Ferruginibacter sp.]